MKLIKRNHKIAAVLLTISALSAVAPAQAYQTTYRLCQSGGLASTIDANGVNTNTKGYVYVGSSYVGTYIETLRSAFNIAGNKGALRILVNWRYGDHNFTLEGNHDYGSGAAAGSVSANSVGFRSFEDATFQATTSGSCRNVTVSY